MSQSALPNSTPPPAVQPSQSQPATRVTKKFSLPIRWTLPVLMITPLMLGMGATGWLAFQSGQETVNELADQIGVEMTERIEGHLTSHLEQPEVVNNLIMGDIQSGDLNLQDEEAVRRSFWRITQFDQLTNNLYYGNQQGEFLAVIRKLDGQYYFYRKDSDQINREVYRLDSNGTVADLDEVQEYDPRQRPWYQPTLNAAEGIWTRIYPSASPPDLTITRTLPVYDAAGDPRGVLGIDVYLMDLSHFLRDLDISENGKAFIVERSGELVATSQGEPFAEVNGEQVRLAATDSPSAPIRQTADYLLAEFGSYEAIQDPQALMFDLDQQNQMVYAYPIGQEVGLDWLVVVTMPEADFMGSVHDNVRHTLIAGLTITGVAALLGLAISLWITRPISRLNRAAKRIQKGTYQLDELKDVESRPDEFGELAELFNSMAIVVNSREQSLEEQVNALRSEIDQYGSISSIEQESLRSVLQRARHVRQSVQEQHQD